MSNLEDLLVPTYKTKNKVRLLLGSLPENEARALRDALLDQDFSHSDIARALKSAGHTHLSREQIGHFRRRLNEGKEII